MEVCVRLMFILNTTDISFKFIMSQQTVRLVLQGDMIGIVHLT